LACIVIEVSHEGVSVRWIGIFGAARSEFATCGYRLQADLREEIFLGEEVFVLHMIDPGSWAWKSENSEKQVKNAGSGRKVVRAECAG
jgi:hypothetical protein